MDYRRAFPEASTWALGILEEEREVLLGEHLWGRGGLLEEPLRLLETQKRILLDETFVAPPLAVWALVTLLEERAPPSPREASNEAKNLLAALHQEVVPF